MTCPHSHSDGAYVLGALCPAERAAYESHLNECEACAAAVARLAPVPGLLGRVDPVFLQRPYPLLADADTSDPAGAGAPGVGADGSDPAGAGPAGAGPDGVDPAGPAPGAARPGATAGALTGPARLTRLLRAAGEERRRQARTRRWQLVAVAAAVVVLMVGGGLVWSVVTGAGSAPEGTAMWPVTGDPESVAVTAEVDLSATGAGVAVWWRCAYPAGRTTGQTWDEPAPWVFRLVAVGQDGSREQIGSWLAGPGDEVTMTGITRFGWDELDRLELRGYDDTHLLTYEPS